MIPADALWSSGLRLASDNAAVRLIRRKRTGEPSITERECYERAYGENVLGNVDIVPREPTEEPAEKSTEAETQERPTTDSVKRQLEERLAARARHNPNRSS
jgi:hypothetical protein